jgi:uncharacterized repeat protein (TIGR04076 family)
MFKVRCRLIAFDGDEETFPCHFNYKIGDEFYYDGVYFTGRICSGLFASMMPVIHNVHLMGNGFSRNIPYKYRFDVRNPDMAKYDGAGFSPRKTLPESGPPSLRILNPLSPKKETIRGARFTCSDTRTLAQFLCEAIDLSDSDYCQPFYRRALAILDKIAKEPGIKPPEILERFTPFERDDISPTLTPPFLEVMLAALIEMDYVVLKDEGLYATARIPPSRKL